MEPLGMSSTSTARSPPLVRRSSSCRPAAPLPEDRPQRCLRIPIWVVQVALVVTSLSVVGVVSCVLTRANAEAGVARVGHSYRSLASTMVENEVVSYLTVLTIVTQKLAENLAASSISSADPMSEDMRKELIFTMAALAGQSDAPTSAFLGTPDGGFLGIDTQGPNGALEWALSSAETGFRFGHFPATAAGTPPCTATRAAFSSSPCGGRLLWQNSSWLSRFEEIQVIPVPYNATSRLWFQAATSTSQDVILSPAYASMSPVDGEGGLSAALALPVVAPVRSESGRLIAVIGTERTVTYFDRFLHQISSTLFEGTVVFLVEIPTGYLLASSIEGQQMVSHFTPSGEPVRVLAVEASNEAIRTISRSLSDPATGWAAFGDQNQHVSAGTFGGYMVDVRRVNLEGLQWAMVVGTDADSWTSMVNKGLPLTLGLVGLVVLGTALLATLLVRLFTAPLIRLVREVELLCALDVVQVRPFSRSVYKEIDTLTQAFNTLTRSLAEYRKFMPE
eukprot:RCo017279